MILFKYLTHSYVHAQLARRSTVLVVHVILNYFESVADPTIHVIALQRNGELKNGGQG